MATYGPDNATLTVHTKRGGAAAKAGHDLTILVERWSATDDDGELSFEADSRSLRVHRRLRRDHVARRRGEGVDQRRRSTRRCSRARRSPTAAASSRSTASRGRSTYSFDGTEGRAEIKQTDFKIKPYSALFGTLKVADVVEVKVRRTNG